MKWKETTAIRRTNAKGFRVGVDFFLAKNGDTWCLFHSARGNVKSRTELNLVEAGMMLKKYNLVGRYSTLFKGERSYRTAESWAIIDMILEQRN